MTTEQRMYELFLDELERDIQILESESGSKSRYIAQLENDTTEECARLRQAHWKMNESHGEACANYEKIIHQHEWAIKNLINAIGIEINKSEILTRLNKPKC